MTKKSSKLEKTPIEFDKNESADRAEFLNMAQTEIDQENNPFYKVSKPELRKRVDLIYKPNEILFVVQIKKYFSIENR